MSLEMIAIYSIGIFSAIFGLLVLGSYLVYKTRKPSGKQ